MTTTTTTDDRAGYTAGLRQLADLLDAHPEIIPLPTQGNFSPISICVWDREGFLAAVRALPGMRSKAATTEDYYRVDALLSGGLKVQVVTTRDTVCERVVTGTREVTREVPDPAALATVPMQTVTETVEDVEWVCLPLTAPAEQVSA